MDAELLVRFRSRCELSTGGCWLWKGAVTGDGYATISKDNKTRYVHRMAYEHFVAPIDAGLVVDHLCRVRNCVNPEHLEAVTNKENLRRGATATQPATHCKRGHEFTADNTAIQGSTGRRRCRTCRDQYARERYAAAATRP